MKIAHMMSSDEGIQYLAWLMVNPVKLAAGQTIQPFVYKPEPTMTKLQRDEEKCYAWMRAVVGDKAWAMDNDELVGLTSRKPPKPTLSTI